MSVVAESISMGRIGRQRVEDAVSAVRQSTPPQRGVLVVEADPDLQWRLARMLTVQGYRVVGTSSGDGALALMGQWPVDLVLLDEQLPGTSGLDVAERICREHPAIPVVLMTRDPGPETHMAARLAGAFACLAKPLGLEALQEIAEQLFAPAAEPAE